MNEATPEESSRFLLCSYLHIITPDGLTKETRYMILGNIFSLIARTP
jgi:hypothetical protein